MICVHKLQNPEPPDRKTSLAMSTSPTNPPDQTPPINVDEIDVFTGVFTQQEAIPEDAIAKAVEVMQSLSLIHI